MLIDDKGIALTKTAPSDPIEAVLDAICRAPSGGNVQPWRITVDKYGIYVRIAWDRTSLMDIDYRGSYVAIGAALFNAKITALYHGLGVRITEFPEGFDSDYVFTIEFVDSRSGINPSHRETYKSILARETNRHLGAQVKKIHPYTTAALQKAAGMEGATLHLMTHRDDVAALADVLAESDRIRYLTQRLHEEMMSELVGGARGDERSGQGIAVETLALPVYDLPKLRILRDWRNMQALLAMSGETDGPVGEGLGASTRDRVNASSAVAVLTVDGSSPADYLRGGMALERFWSLANYKKKLALQPVSPVFLYAHNRRELAKQSPEFCGDLAALQERFNQVVGLVDHAHQRPILVLRVSHDAPETTHSRRLSRPHVITDLR